MEDIELDINNNLDLNIIMDNIVMLTNTGK